MTKRWSIHNFFAKAKYKYTKGNENCLSRANFYLKLISICFAEVPLLLKIFLSNCLSSYIQFLNMQILVAYPFSVLLNFMHEISLWLKVTQIPELYFFLCFFYFWILLHLFKKSRNWSQYASKWKFVLVNLSALSR